MLLRAWSPSAVGIVLAGMAAVVTAACGSAIPPVSAPDPVAAPAPAGMRDAGAPSADAVLAASVYAGSCDLVGPEGYTLSLSGSSSASASGNETLQCRGTVTPAPARTEFYSGLPCYLPQTADWTSRSTLTLRSNGGASLKCQAK